MENDNMAWYRKYRPTTMDHYRGDAIKEQVRARFRVKANRPQVMMISGERGCGKTTFCRIITKYYLCQSPNPDGTPCEHCETCTEINESMIDAAGVPNPSIREVDNGDARSVDKIQEIIEEAMQPPVYGDYKIVIFDECHEMSRVAQNSLLKTLEDIPKHLVIIFATTDPDKLLSTIHSRCQLKLTVHKQSVESMAARLMEISQQEGLRVSQKALELIAKKGDKVPRECIQILENVAKSCDGEVTVANVQKYSGGIDPDIQLQFFEAANSGLVELLTLLNYLKDHNISYKDFADELCSFVMGALKIKLGISLDDFAPDFVKKVKTLFSIYESQDIDMLLQIIEKASLDMTTAAESTHEMLLTLMGMRISKVKLLAQGLSSEDVEAIAENKVSLAEHTKFVKGSFGGITEEKNYSLENDEDIQDTFVGVKQVEDETAKRFRALLDEAVADDDEDEEVAVEEKAEEQENILDRDLF